MSLFWGKYSSLILVNCYSMASISRAKSHALKMALFVTFSLKKFVYTFRQSRKIQITTNEICKFEWNVTPSSKKWLPTCDTSLYDTNHIHIHIARKLNATKFLRFFLPTYLHRKYTIFKKGFQVGKDSVRARK